MNRALNVFLAFLRIAAGLSLILTGWTKLAWFSDPTLLQQRLAAFTQAAPYPFVAKYLNAVAPHAGWLSKLVVVGELGLGALLLLGLLTPFAALLAFIMVAQFQFASGALFTRKYFAGESGLVYLISLLVLFAGRAGQSLGLDGVIGRSMAGGGAGGGQKR
jgi:uncharacterized membrane protein YphA (DoxX/SURF4 family)